MAVSSGLGDVTGELKAGLASGDSPRGDLLIRLVGRLGRVSRVVSPPGDSRLGVMSLMLSVEEDGTWSVTVFMLGGGCPVVGR